MSRNNRVKCNYFCDCNSLSCTSICTKVKNVWNCTSTFLCGFKICTVGTSLPYFVAMMMI